MEQLSKTFVSGLVALIAATVGWADEDGFSRSLAAEDFKAAGLGHLSSAERMRLDKLVEAYNEGLVRAAQRAAQEARAARQAAEAETKAVKAEAAGARESSRGFSAKAKVLLVPGTTIEYSEIKSTVVGSFEGWQGRTVFLLANGQRWQVANANEQYFTPPKDDVVVEIRPSALAGFWMYVPALGTRVRVRLLGDK